MATRLTFTPFCFFILWIANRFCFALGLFCNRLQKTREPRQNFSKTLGYASCATLSIWPHFDARQRGIYLLDLSSHLNSPALCIIISFPFLLSRVSLVILLSWRILLKTCRLTDILIWLGSCCSWRTVNFLSHFPTSCLIRDFFVPFFLRGRNRRGLAIFPLQILHDWRFSWSCNPHLKGRDNLRAAIYYVFFKQLASGVSPREMCSATVMNSIVGKAL